MPPTFYFALGARPRRRDLVVALLVGQRHFLVPAGSPGATLLQQTPTVHVVLDSWAYPPGNTDRPSLPRYAHLLAGWHCNHAPVNLSNAGATFDWALSYDTIGDAVTSERDEDRLRSLFAAICPCVDPPIVPITHYPGIGAAAIIGDLRGDRDVCFDEQERTEATRRQAWGFLDAADGPTDWPVYAIGGLVPARYAREAAAWYEQLIAELDAASNLDPFQRRVHLLGVGKPSWVLRSPLVMSFDSSGPARLATTGFDHAIARSYCPDYVLSIAKLRRSREARLAYHLIAYRARVGLPWQHVDEALLLDDREVLSPPLTEEALWEQQVLAAL
ncbi:MAG: hypothetical protein RLZZ387_4921 [Chloroflexota bacterium]|jgi:hypothetical protein